MIRFVIYQNGHQLINTWRLRTWVGYIRYYKSNGNMCNYYVRRQGFRLLICGHLIYC